MGQLSSMQPSLDHAGSSRQPALNHAGSTMRAVLNHAGNTMQAVLNSAGITMQAASHIPQSASCTKLFTRVIRGAAARKIS